MNCKIALSIIATSVNDISVVLKERLTRRRGEPSTRGYFLESHHTDYVHTDPVSFNVADVFKIFSEFYARSADIKEP